MSQTVPAHADAIHPHEPDWLAYYEVVAQHPPRDRLLRGLSIFDQATLSQLLIALKALKFSYSA